MFVKILVCVTLSVVQVIHAQYINGAYPGAYPNNLVAEAALANNYAIPNPVYEHSLTQIGANAVNNGGTFVVKSSSPIAPNGMRVQSENLLVEGPLAVSGQLPFLGVVSLEGPLPAAGHGAVAYNCGNGEVGIVNENEGISNAYAGITNAAYANGVPNAGYANAGIPNAGYVNAGIPNGGYVNAGIPNGGYVNSGIANSGIVNNGLAGARVY